MTKTQLKKNILKILLKISNENYTHDCEYAGHMDQLCAYCWNEQLEIGKQSHAKDCIHVLAIKTIEELKRIKKEKV